MSFVGMTSTQEVYPHIDNSERDSTTAKPKPSLICAVTITRTASPTDQPIKEEDAGKVLFDSGPPDKSQETVQAMNVENDAKSNLAARNKMLFLLTYDIHSSLATSVTTVVHTSNSSGNSKPSGSKKVCAVARADVANIYDDIYLQYSDDDTELPQCTKNILDEQISNVININASSSKEDSKMWEPKINFIVTKQYKVLPPPPPPPPTALLPELPESGQGSMLDFVGKMSQLKSWKSGNIDSVGTKLADQTDASVLQADPITHYLNMNGPLEISGLKWYETGEGTEKVKVTSFGGSKGGTQTAVSNSNNDGFDSDPPQEEIITQGIAIQCLSLPSKLHLTDKSQVTHLIPTEDKEHLLVVISSIDPVYVKNDAKEVATDGDGDVNMEETERSPPPDSTGDVAYFILYSISSKSSVYTLEDNPVTIKEVPHGESPVDICLLPKDKHDVYSIAVAGLDGVLRLYTLPDFKVISEKKIDNETFTSITYCAGVERLSASTKLGKIYFYAMNDSEKDAAGDMDEDYNAIDSDMSWLTGLPDSDQNAPTVIIANKPEIDTTDLETLMSLTGSKGDNATVPYTAVVPGFWCELSPAQRPRGDNQNNRTWRLQNTSSTWDEHVLELTSLPARATLSHVEFNFGLHTPCTTNLPVIQVTLLKQNLHGIGYKKDATFGNQPDSPIKLSVDPESSTSEDPNSSEDYLQAQNAEILAGPLLLASGLDMTRQSGTLILTSPRLFRAAARGHTFLIHIKTLFDPAKDMSKGSIKSGESGAKKSGFIGCDWLHQISITVQSSPLTDMPVEIARQQRIAMLESNGFLNTLCEIAISMSDSKRRKMALDLMIWVLSIRLQRLRLTKTEKSKEAAKEEQAPVDNQQLECVRIVEKHVDSLIKNCILCSTRSIAKKTVKIMLITGE